MANNDLFNKDELKHPEWLNESFFGELLKNIETLPTKLTNFVLKPGTLRNDHYASILYRAKITYDIFESSAARALPFESREKSIILKIEPFTDGYKKDILGGLKIFETEIRMYTEVLPKIERVLRQYGDETVLGPKLLHFSKASPVFVAFEDLALKGYTTVGNRHTNMDEVKFALMKLAKLHAISYKLNQEHDNSLATLETGIMNSLDIDNFNFIKNATKYLKEVLAEHYELNQFAPLIDSIDNIVIPKTIAMFNEAREGKCGDDDGIYVLNHGDFHSKNIMIRSSDGSLRDLMLLDYQMSVFGSPAIDLHYAFTMMFSPNMRRNHHDELLYYYVTIFQETLRKTEFHGRIPTIVEFRQELQKHRYWGLFLVLSFLIFSYIFADEQSDLAEVIENEESQKKQLQDTRLITELKYLLPQFLYEGYFEYGRCGAVGRVLACYARGLGFKPRSEPNKFF